MTLLHEEHSSALMAFVSGYVHDARAAEDVVQETFLRAWRHIGRLDTAKNPRAYLFTVARNVLTDQWRAEQRRPRTTWSAPTEDQTPTVDDTDAALEGWVTAEAIGRLSPEHRAVVQAVYFEGRSVAEAAELLQLAPGTVKSRSYYAIRALRDAFAEMGVLR